MGTVALKDHRTEYSARKRLPLTAHTVARLRASQIAHRVRLRTQRALLSRLPRGWERPLRRLPSVAPGWPVDFQPLEARLAIGAPSQSANREGRFSFLNEERDLGRAIDWAAPGADQLWRYHLHYWEWAWSFLRQPDRQEGARHLVDLWTSWREACPPGRGDPWAPYVVSLRLWVLCGLYEEVFAPSPAGRSVMADIALHARYIAAHQELDIGGNHILKNLKALLGVGIFLGWEGMEARARRRLVREIGLQVLADGAHFELSPAYHAQVLGDLIDIAGLLRTAGRIPEPALDEAIRRMQAWLGAILLPDGDVPFFNDCWPVGRDRLTLLDPDIPPAARCRVLAESGYVVIRPDRRLHLVLDAGPPGPEELPAHIHADGLSFELAVDGKRVVVNSGTSTYAPGARRRFERSTAAHSTVEIDGKDQTEVWETFRAGRRACVKLLSCQDQHGELVVSGEHDGYARLPGAPRHRRTWRVRPGEIVVEDEIQGTGATATSVARFYLAQDMTASDEDGWIRAGPLELDASGGELNLQPADLASSFGVRQPGQVVTVSRTGPLPHHLILRLQLTTTEPSLAMDASRAQGADGQAGLSDRTPPSRAATD